MVMGNVGKEPEIRQTNSGTSVANFSIATSERWKDKEGEQHEKTTWHNCVVWGPLCKIVESYVEKGSRLFVQGRLQKRHWKDRDDNDRENVEINVERIELIGARWKKSESDDLDDEEEERPRKSKPKVATKPNKSGLDDLDDEIPW
jgi:single-strand DNA-binding protein